MARKKNKQKNKKSAKARARVRARDKTIEAAFRGEVNTKEKVIPEKKIYSRKKKHKTSKGDQDG